MIEALRVGLSTLSLKKAKVEQTVIKETSDTQHFQGVFISSLIISAEEESETTEEKEKKIKSTLVRMSKHQQGLHNTDKNSSPTKKARKRCKSKA